MKSRMEIVAGIPVDQTQKATTDIKKLLLEKLRLIQHNRWPIEEAANQLKREEVVEAYKKAVDFKSKSEAIAAAEKAVKEAFETLMKTGLSRSGAIMELTKQNHHGDKGIFFKDPYSHMYIKITKSEADAHVKLKKLLKAVEKEMDIFSSHDQLETRMMMASTVGECMAIVNAVADRDVFKIDEGILKLTAGTATEPK